MFPAFRSGKMSTLACPATRLVGALRRPSSGSSLTQALAQHLQRRLHGLQLDGLTVVLVPLAMLALAGVASACPMCKDSIPGSTDAAQAGGFADSAHFSRTFRRMFGIAPVSVRPE